MWLNLDYCDIYLTHDSLAVRRAHNSGWKHQAQVKDHYANIAKGFTQVAIGNLTRPFGNVFDCVFLFRVGPPGGMPFRPPPGHPSPQYQMPPGGPQGPPGMMPGGPPQRYRPGPPMGMPQQNMNRPYN
jgi:U1 small nuclear ribonucleoprotein C